MPQEDMRASDGDREATAARLKTALDEGRLDLHEYDERLQRTYAAKTYGDLQGLLTDLPGVAPASASQMEPARPAAQPAQAAAPAESGRAPHWLGGYAAVFVVCVLIWVATSLGSGQWQYFWPIWMTFPLVFGALAWFRGRR